MPRKKKITSQPTREQLEELRLKTSTPLEKVDDALDVSAIIRDDAKLVKVHFMSEMMVRHKNTQEIRAEYEKKFGESISACMVGRLRSLVRAVYLAEISKNRDEMVAEELLHANWEMQELQAYWERSKAGKKKTVKHDAVSDGTELTTYDLHETTETTEETYGDLEAIKLMGNVRNRVIDLLGLNAPKQQAEDKGSGVMKLDINIVGSKRVPTDIQEAEVVQ